MAFFETLSSSGEEFWYTLDAEEPKTPLHRYRVSEALSRTFGDHSTLERGKPLDWA